MIKLAYDNDAQRGDLVRTDGLNLETDEGLETAVSISLFTDARARGDDSIPEGADKRGWWGGAYLSPEGELGSRLWLVRHNKATTENLNRAVAYGREALQWLVSQKVASSVIVTAERARFDLMLLTVKIQRPSNLAPRWERTWEVQLGV